MKKFYVFCQLFLLGIVCGFAQDNCENFNTSQGNWQTSAAGITISNSAPNADGTNYMRGTDAASTTGSWIYNETDYTGNLGDNGGTCLCWDYKVFDDSAAGSPNMNPRIVIYQGTVTNQTLRATYVSNTTITENSPWVNVCPPSIVPATNALPSDANGAWVMPAGSTIADWNNLISNISGVAFGTDVAGSSTQDEVLGIDNFCATTCCDPTDSPAFDIEISCDNGNKCVTVTSNDPNIPNHWWGLMEISDYSNPNDTSDSNTANSGTPVTLITGQSSATFCWLDLSKRYYIKHGIWDPGCYTWREVRTPVPNFEADAVFHFEDENDNIKDEFCYGEDVILDGTASQGENRYYIDAWRRPIGTNGNFNWYAGLGWTLNSTVGEVNLSQEFANLSNPRYFEPGFEYEIKLAVMNLDDCIGWTPVTHTFTVVCCDDFLDASFHSQQATTGNIEILSFDLYDNVNATHEWFILSSPNQNGGPYTPVLNTTSTGPAPFTFPINAQSGLFYTVIHRVTTLCGEICSTNVHYYTRGESIGKSSLYIADVEDKCQLIDEVFPECQAPTNLRYDCKRAQLSWSGDPNADYVVQVNWGDPTCCRTSGNNPVSISRNVRGTSFTLPFIHESRCFSWRVGIRCKDGTIKWSRLICSDCITRPDEDGPTKPVDADVKTEAKISPNPNDGNMNIEISGRDKTDFTLNVYRFDGILVKTFDKNRIENKLTTITWNGKSVLTPGMYFFVITTDKETVTKKVIVK
ncbi:T9SS type A sorting domain-containing protein [Kordia sp.]|uniref:T9SS type A sorting domain-containing protein n=1 Tax=Kordia sp. TaxID=1965332 RepID=UPI003B5B13F3